MKQEIIELLRYAEHRKAVDLAEKAGVNVSYERKLLVAIDAIEIKRRVEERTFTREETDAINKLNTLIFNSIWNKMELSTP